MQVIGLGLAHKLKVSTMMSIQIKELSHFLILMKEIPIIQKNNSGRNTIKRITNLKEQRQERNLQRMSGMILMISFNLTISQISLEMTLEELITKLTLK